MAILELRGLKVLPPPDLDDGESLWIGWARGNHGRAVVRGAGFWSELSRPQTMEAGCSAGGHWIFGEDSEQCQSGGTRRPAIRRRSDSTNIK